MNSAYILLGVALLALAVVDTVWTTLWVDGGSGPVSSRLTALLWRGLRRLGDSRSSLRSLSGPLMPVATLATWVAAIWGGWTLVFAGADGALVMPASRAASRGPAVSTSSRTRCSRWGTATSARLRVAGSSRQRSRRPAGCSSSR